MSTEYGIFTDEGKIEGDFYSAEEAERVLCARYGEETDGHVGACCHDHPEQEAANCELCNAEEEDEPCEE